MEQEGKEGVDHIQKSYAAVLTMADTWLGKLFDTMDAYHMWEDTAVILTTDHGHLLGEHGYWAKNYTFDYRELTHIPLCIYTPDTSYTPHVNALSCTLDIMPTILQLHGIAKPQQVQGKSMLPLLTNSGVINHNEVIFGYFNKDMNMFDGHYTYCRQPDLEKPLYQYTLCTDTRDGFISKELLAEAKYGQFLPYADGVPQLKIPCKPYRHDHAPDYDLVYDILKDPEQTTPIHDKALVTRLSNKLDDVLRRYEAPCMMDK